MQSLRDVNHIALRGHHWDQNPDAELLRHFQHSAQLRLQQVGIFTQYSHARLMAGGAAVYTGRHTTTAHSGWGHPGQLMERLPPDAQALQGANLRGWLAALVARNNKPASSAYRAKPNKTRASRRRECSKN
jgi:hypothetical protein